MKNTGTCPKCGSQDLLYVEGYVGSHGSGNNIYLRFGKSIPVDRFVCGSCGYTEEWIREGDIDRLREKYPGVQLR